VVALIVSGPRKLPELMVSAGRYSAELSDVVRQAHGDLTAARTETVPAWRPQHGRPSEPGSTA
jgi:Sec-independent protein translocase protein TatA